MEKKNNTRNKKWPKKGYGWLNSFFMEKEKKPSLEGKKSISTYLLPPPPPPPPPKKNLMPPLPSEHRGWNTGKNDCRHYCSHSDFSVHIGTMKLYRGGRVIKKLTDNNT